jgi:hypothetical protein
MKKRLFIFLALANLIGLVNAQNTLFVDFQNTYEQVVQSMADRPYVTIESAQPGEELVISAQGGTYRYRFNRGWLFEIEATRSFAKRRLAKQAYRSCESYFELINANQLTTIEDRKAYQESVYVRTGRVYRVQYKKQPDDQLQVVLRSRYTAYTPITQWEASDYEAGYELLHTLNYLAESR